MQFVHIKHRFLHNNLPTFFFMIYHGAIGFSLTLKVKWVKVVEDFLRTHMLPSSNRYLAFSKLMRELEISYGTNHMSSIFKYIVHLGKANMGEQIRV